MRGEGKMDDESYAPWKGNNYFTEQDIDGLLKILSKTLGQDQRSKLLQYLNKCTLSLLIDWEKSQKRNSPSENIDKFRMLEKSCKKFIKYINELDWEAREHLFHETSSKFITSTKRVPICLQSQIEEKEQLARNASQAVQSILNGIPSAISIYEKRVARNKNSPDRNKGEEELDQLYWNLLKGWKIYFCTRVNYWNKNQPSIIFVHECLQIIRKKIEGSLREDKHLMHQLNVNPGAVRDRVSNLPKRMIKRFREARKFREYK